jgi:hypothetical protein
MPQWDYPLTAPYSIYQCERPYAEAPQLIKCRLRQPLKSLNHIRLLKVYPPGWPDRLNENVAREEDPEIQCDIYQVALADVTTKKRPYFATLSYVWGDTNVTREIRCGKERSLITLSLYEALVHIRNLRTPRLLWVDSLCINQSDEEEKGLQVQRMYLIYGQSHCISWLGIESEERDDLKSMFPFLKWFSEIDSIFDKRDLPKTWEAVNDHVNHNPAHGISDLRQVPWKDLHQCLDRDYFVRLWCVQEILVARSNDIRTSKTRIDIAVLARSLYLITIVFEHLRRVIAGEPSMLKITGCSWDETGKLQDVCNGISRMLMTDALPSLDFKKKVTVEHTTAWSVAEDYFWYECSNPRDHIYGLAALCNLGSSYQISYSSASLTLQEVFIDFTLHCLRTTRSLETFSAPFRKTTNRDGSTPDLHLAHRTRTLGLPSWCADFAGPRPAIRGLVLNHRNRSFPLRASRDHLARLTLTSRRKIGVVGMQVATVKADSTDWRATTAAESFVDWSSYSRARITSTQKCISSAKALVPAKSLWRLYLDVRSTGIDWRDSPAWSRMAHLLPPSTRDRMVKSSIGAAWIMSHVPQLALEAGLSLNRKISPEYWRQLADDTDPWVFSHNIGTRLFATDNPRAILGTGPEGLCVGDVVCVLFGGDVPFILRPSPQGNYQLIGECYVSGIMRGEALDMGLEEREFLLV